MNLKEKTKKTIIELICSWVNKKRLECPGSYKSYSRIEDDESIDELAEEIMKKTPLITHPSLVGTHDVEEFYDG